MIYRNILIYWKTTVADRIPTIAIIQNRDRTEKFSADALSKWGEHPQRIPGYNLGEGVGLYRKWMASIEMLHHKERCTTELVTLGSTDCPSFNKHSNTFCFQYSRMSFVETIQTVWMCFSNDAPGCVMECCLLIYHALQGRARGEAHSRCHLPRALWCTASVAASSPLGRRMFHVKCTRSELSYLHLTLLFAGRLPLRYDRTIIPYHLNCPTRPWWLSIAVLHYLYYTSGTIAVLEDLPYNITGGSVLQQREFDRQYMSHSRHHDWATVKSDSEVVVAVKWVMSLVVIT